MLTAVVPSSIGKYSPLAPYFANLALITRGSGLIRGCKCDRQSRDLICWPRSDALGCVFRPPSSLRQGGSASFRWQVVPSLGERAGPARWSPGGGRWRRQASWPPAAAGRSRGGTLAAPGSSVQGLLVDVWVSVHQEHRTPSATTGNARLSLQQ